MTFKPSVPLATAARNALKAFAVHRPTAYKLAYDHSEAGDRFVSDYALSLINVTLDVIEEAAQKWICTREDYPNPASFGAFARSMDRERHGVVVGKIGPSQELAQSEKELRGLKDFENIDRLGWHAHKELGSWPLVMECWSILYTKAPTIEASLDVRDGRISLDDFQLAADLVKTGVRAVKGPLSGSIVDDKKQPIVK